MEFADDGDLYQKIVEHKKRKELFEESEIWSVLIQTVLGLKTLHNLNILHRDLKVPPSTCRAPTSSSPKLARPSWAISMSPKSPRMGYYTPKQEPPTMPVRRYGKMSPTTANQISGH